MRVTNFLNCGRYARVQWSEKLMKLRIVSSSCGMRICPRCGLSRRAEAARIIADMVQNIDNRQWKFVTLTIQSSGASLAGQLDHLTSSFRRLRQTKLWQSRPRFGKAIIEVSFNHDLQQWHPHLHVLMNTAFIPQKALSAQWLKATGGSPIVDIRVLQSKTQAAKYVAKYLGKLPDFEDFTHPEQTAAAFYYAMTKRTMVIHFGVHPELLNEQDQQAAVNRTTDWTDVGSLIRILDYARLGRSWACEIIAGLGAEASLKPEVDPEIFRAPP